VLIAYNRRFYDSVEQAKEKIREDGGILSLQMDFTEWGHIVESLPTKPEVKESWLLANSTHVIDLAFHLAGAPKDWKCWHRGTIPWHKSAARFCGSGVTEKGVLFSYISDWQSAGRWGIEIMTPQHRLVLRPLEELQIIKRGTLNLQDVEPISDLDRQFKPGLFRQTKAFLDGNSPDMCTLSDQIRNIEYYKRIAGYI
jgi:hypothetical protein